MERITKEIISGNRLIPKFNVVPPLTVTETKEYFEQLKDYGIFEVKDVNTDTAEEVKVETSDKTIEAKTETKTIDTIVEVKVQETAINEIIDENEAPTEKKGFSIKPTGLRKK
jgi:hypothetical protein